MSLLCFLFIAAGEAPHVRLCVFPSPLHLFWTPARCAGAKTTTWSVCARPVCLRACARTICLRMHGPFARTVCLCTQCTQQLASNFELEIMRTSVLPCLFLHARGLSARVPSVCAHARARSVCACMVRLRARSFCAHNVCSSLLQTSS